MPTGERLQKHVSCLNGNLLKFNIKCNWSLVRKSTDEYFKMLNNLKPWEKASEQQPTGV